MRTRPVDPRDQTTEFDAPAYRVYFWPTASSCEEWELTGADLDEVLAWVDDHSAGRPHSLWAVVSYHADDVSLIRLRGIDPPADPQTWPSWAHEARAGNDETHRSN